MAILPLATDLPRACRVLLIAAFALFLLQMTGCRSGLEQINAPGPLAQVLHLEELSPAADVVDVPALPISLGPDKPSNDRDFVPEHKVLAQAEFDGNLVHVKNVRNCEFYSYRDCLVDHYDKTYDLSKLQTVDFLMVPFNESPALAHTMLSFGFEGGDYVGISVEVRLEQGESYHPAIGLFSQFELIYVVADERDLIRVRTEYRDVDVLVFRTKTTPQMARRLFVDVMKRVNKLHDEPEFYDTLSNNCTTNLVRHINKLAPDTIPHDYRVLLPGFADSLAYELGLLDNSVPLNELKRRARVNDLALRYKDAPDFSQRIRGEKLQ